jgi:hypothetical protein
VSWRDSSAITRPKPRERTTHPLETSGAKGFPFAPLSQVFFSTREIIRKIRDFDEEDTPHPKEKITKATAANFYQLSFQ